MHSWPEARVVTIDGDVLIEEGASESGTWILPGDVSLATSGWDDREDEDQRTSLSESLHEVVRHLLSTPDASDPGQHLLEHYRRFGGLDLCIHGRPLWHKDDRIRAVGSCDRAEVQRLEDNLDFINILEALSDGGRATLERNPIPLSALRKLLSVLPARRRGRVQAHLQRQGEKLTADERRGVIEDAANGMLRDCGVRTHFTWPVGRRPELTLISDTTVGLYVVDVIRWIHSPQKAHKCSACGESIQPKREPRPGELTYCTKTECKRARYRRNKRRERERKRDEGGQ